MKWIYMLTLSLFWTQVDAQTNLAAYLGNEGGETLYDALQLSDGSILAVGYTDQLDWLQLDVVPQVLTYSGAIPNGLGTNRYGMILHLTSDLSAVLHALVMPQGAVEDVRFIKTNAMPFQTTQDLYISCTTADTYDNDGGYIIAKLNGNFVNQVPTGLEWQRIVWAESYAQQNHPWDVTSDGRVYYVSGAAHGYDWSALYCLDAEGNRMTVEHWRTHWLVEGGEWRGAPASSYQDGIEAIAYSGIALKIWGRCELRSWSQSEFDSIEPDGNGGLKKGHWPADFLFSGPCDPNDPSADGPGYNGYSAEACCPVWGASSIVVDRSNNHMYLGMNFKSYSQPADSPDFEPAVIAFDDEGAMQWWSRLYHEITPAGDTVYSLPDQYIDALAIDYTHQQLVVAARAHGNNTENLWEGDEINANPAAYGFQNRFTGTNGNIHQSWLGKLRLNDGTLMHSTYVAEYAEATNGLGAPLSDPNAGNWPDPNSGWPDLNTTYIVKNNIKISTNGDVLMAGQGRRTMTTLNAWQQMPLPQGNAQGCWNSFVRLYDHQLTHPKYSSLVVGQWDTLTQQGGDNIRLFGLCKTQQGVIAVGRHMANAEGTSLGIDMPVSNVPAWANDHAQGESAVIVYLQTDSLSNSADGFVAIDEFKVEEPKMTVHPNPTNSMLFVKGLNGTSLNKAVHYRIWDQVGRLVQSGAWLGQPVQVEALLAGYYVLEVQQDGVTRKARFAIIR